MHIVHEYQLVYEYHAIEKQWKTLYHNEMTWKSTNKTDINLTPLTTNDIDKCHPTLIELPGKFPFKQTATFLLDSRR